MTRRGLLVAALGLWLAVLAVLFRPRTAHAPHIHGAPPLDNPNRDLPTIDTP